MVRWVDPLRESPARERSVLRPATHRPNGAARHARATAGVPAEASVRACAPAATDTSWPDIRSDGLAGRTAASVQLGALAVGTASE